MTSRKRTLAAFATGALALPLLTAPAAFAQTATPAVQTIADFCVNAPEESPFNDIQTLAAEIQNAINCLAFADVTDGTAADKYSPERNVNRDQMARFIAQLIDSANEFETADGDIADLGPEDGTPQFIDTAGNFHFSEIERLAQEDIVNGGVGGRPANQYVPGQGVTRAQMATFIVNAIEFMTGETIVVPAGADYFTDDEGNVHEERINKLASLGVVQGVAAGTYQPDRVVNRDNMALFLARTLGELEERGLITAPAAPQDEATVTAGDVEGGEVVLTVAGEDVESVTVTGDCIADQTFAAADDEDADTDGNQFTVVLNDDAAAGDCVLTVVTSFTEESGLADETDTVTVTVPEVVSNETIALGPDDAQVIQPVTANAFGEDVSAQDDADAADNRSFTATGLDGETTYRITLVSCDNVTANDNGTVSFAFAEGDTEEDGDNLADATGTSADIISINGAATTNNEVDEDGADNIPGNADDNSANAESYTATPVNGAITFTIDGDTAECVVPVIYVNGAEGETNENGGSSPRLELDENGVPVEAFGIGGETTFLPEEAPNGSDESVEVIFVDEEENFFVGDNNLLYFYDENDDFQYDEDEFSITFAQFEDFLSVGDFVDTFTDGNEGYSREAVSGFDIYVDESTAPSDLTASVTDTDADTDNPATTDINEATAANDVTFTFEAAEEALIEDYTVEIYEASTDVEDDADACAGTFVTSATSDGDETSVVVEDLVDGDYCAVVFATSGTGEDSDDSAPELFTVNAEADDTTAPTLVDAEVVGIGTAGGELDDADNLRFDFSENIDLIAGDTVSLSVTDAEGETFDVVGTVTSVGDNPEDDATNTSDRVLVAVDSVTKTGGIGDGSATLPAEITELGVEFVDGGGNEVDLENSSDTTLNQVAV